MKYCGKCGKKLETIKDMISHTKDCDFISLDKTKWFSSTPKVKKYKFKK